LLPNKIILRRERINQTPTRDGGNLQHQNTQTGGNANVGNQNQTLVITTTSKNRERTTTFLQNSLAYYVVSTTIVLTIASKLWISNG
jgi:hypothetical protein